MSAVRNRLPALALATAGLAVLLFAVAGPFTRLGVWTFGTGFTAMRWGAYLGHAALIVAVVALIAVRPRRRALPAVGLAVLLAGVAIVVPWTLVRTARAVPPIHDITTDFAEPPAFVAVLPLRAGSPNSAEYAGDSVAAQQRAGYPDLGPLRVAAPPAVAFRRAADAARAMGWEMVAADSAAGRVEATATTRWFGFKDDVGVRVRPDGGGSRLEVRSVSRVGGGGGGADGGRHPAYPAPGGHPVQRRGGVPAAVRRAAAGHGAQPDERVRRRHPVLLHVAAQGRARRRRRRRALAPRGAAAGAPVARLAVLTGPAAGRGRAAVRHPAAATRAR